MPASPYSCVLWDVDGTIADASAGILPRLAEVLTAFGRQAPSADELPRWIGPPLFDSFQEHSGMSADEASQASQMYRELAARDGYATSVRIYPGVAEVLQAVKAAGIPQATASSKPENQVVAILGHYGLSRDFVAIAGALPDASGRHEGKPAVIRRALALLDEAGVDTSRPVLIGDRSHDVEGAEPFGIPVIFVDWGFGEPGESTGAFAVVSSPEELQRILLPSP
ncbi:HAD hydrolase-like protein [Microbacterium sp. ASV81]|uniref:HAD hydrolase-like protein n=1 Tax=Microbacterium capsulatum TaxID=3041921 RepID=A0ABU0XJ87_9MICO|nr:HAD hydrolase-like protein [Microbacterium sp. ASV81]MDQ4214729.1 HAD hydrolase-like protein [Microbacterium sp. ASV81]